MTQWILTAAMAFVFIVTLVAQAADDKTRKLFKALDQNSDGKVTPDEFKVPAKGNKKKTKKLEKKFKKVDTDANGSLTAEEFANDGKKKKKDAPKEEVPTTKTKPDAKQIPEGKAAEDSGKATGTYYFKVLLMKDPKLDAQFDGEAPALAKHLAHLIDGVDRRYQALTKNMGKRLRVEIAGQFYASESERKAYEQVSAKHRKHPKDAIRNWLRDWQRSHAKFTNEFEYDVLILLRNAPRGAGSASINTFDSDKSNNVLMINMGDVGPKADGPTRAGLVTHELGHIFGLRHTRARGSIMNANVHAKSTWSKYSISTFKKNVIDSGRLDFKSSTSVTSK